MTSGCEGGREEPRGAVEARVARRRSLIASTSCVVVTEADLDKMASFSRLLAGEGQLGMT